MKGLYEQYYDLSKGLKPEEILSKAKNRINSNKGSKEKKAFEQLEKYLNDVMGPKSPYKQTLEQGALDYLNNRFEQIFDEFDYNTYSASQKSTEDEDIKIILQNTYEAMVHKNYIKISTIKQRLEAIQKQLDYLKTRKDLVSAYSEIYENIKRARSTAIKLLKETEGNISTLDNGEEIFDIRNNENGKNLVDDLDALYSAITFRQKIKVSNQDLGELFERTLYATAPGDKVINTLTDELVSEGMGKSTLGARVVDRGGLIKTTLGKFEIEEESNKGGQNKKYTIKGDGFSYKVSSVFDKKQGKVDVELAIPSQQNLGKFRASAKNWTSLNNGKFGNTSIQAAVLRTTSSVDPAIAYGSALLHTNNTQKRLDNYIKACGLVDILMGYSQTTAYADTIIVNDRSAGRIRVYDMRDMLDIKKLQYVLDLNPPLIKEDIAKINKKYGFVNRILTVLSKHKLTVSSGILTS